MAARPSHRTSGRRSTKSRARRSPTRRRTVRRSRRQRETMAAAVKSDLRDKLLDAAGLALDQLPMLQVIFDRVATYCAESLRHLAASQPYYSLSNVETGRIGDLLEMYEGNALAGIFNVPEWDNHVIVGFDRDFIFSLIEIMFGSDGSEPPIEDGRGFSNIEIHVAHAVFEQVAHALQNSF